MCFDSCYVYTHQCARFSIHIQMVISLQYDINGDGLVEFLLTTTDAEVLFVQTDNTLLHGETIKVCVW